MGHFVVQPRFFDPNFGPIVLLSVTAFAHAIQKTPACSVFAFEIVKRPSERVASGTVHGETISWPSGLNYSTFCVIETFISDTEAPDGHS